MNMHIEEEQQTASDQINWLLHSVIPPVLDRLRDQLTKCHTILTSQNKTDSLPLICNDTIKGFINLTGSYINKAELQIKLPHYYQDNTKATINNTVPYFLEQAQQSINYVSLAINRLQTFSKRSYKQATIELLADIYQYISHAIHAFDYPTEASLFPYKVCHPKYFSPPLKQDLIIEFCIHECHIACNVYALDYNYLKHGTKITPENQSSLVSYKDKSVMIIDEVKTQTQSPTLTELRTSLKLILEWCQTYKHMLLQIEA
ncbi:RAVE subunit 2/Rogdi [Pilobolus umbonatus]|nr:RAVE subunit 2/Rogdi [Pilobolus umbonatus]